MLAAGRAATSRRDDHGALAGLDSHHLMVVSLVSGCCVWPCEGYDSVPSRVVCSISNRRLLQCSARSRNRNQLVPDQVDGEVSPWRPESNVHPDWLCFIAPCSSNAISSTSIAARYMVLMFPAGGYLIVCNRFQPGFPSLEPNPGKVDVGAAAFVCYVNK